MASLAADYRPVTTDRRYRWLAAATAIATYILIGLGGAVRASGSGLGCPDWPLCHGKLMPPLQGSTLIEYTHRTVSAIVTGLVVAGAVVAWRRYRNQRWIAVPALLAVPLLLLQIILGGITVLTELPPTVVAVHLANAMLLLGVLTVAATMTFTLSPHSPTPSLRALGEGPGVRALLPWALGSAAGTYVLIISGALVLGTGASWACSGWPLCNGQVVPGGNLLSLIHMAHRYLAAAIGVAIAVTVSRAWRSRVAALKLWAGLTAAVFVVQVSIGGANVLLRFPPVLDVLHLVTAAGVWAGLVVLSVISFRLSAMTEGERRTMDALRSSSAVLRH